MLLLKVPPDALQNCLRALTTVPEVQSARQSQDPRHPDREALTRRLWPMMAGAVVGTLAGTGFMQFSHAGQAIVGLGVFHFAMLGRRSVELTTATLSAEEMGLMEWPAPLVQHC